ncbi:hypothetical protein ACFOLF_32515 [Paenibacillus sepulcri]|uniref:Nucleoside triphosphate pyrophosphohydrolase n=1 Tax=Paenibacillus sepulcri TaxID=359917 RepID=A0ABS7C598_9BACL|nr:nucleoside triphosphate pyrophosphohydrolase [Paenibacillus sepulcri]
MFTYNKLIRDKIPEIIETKGKKAEVRVLDDVEYKQMLDVKLQEELDEYRAAINDEDQVEELVDLVELVYGILESKCVSIEEFEKLRLTKKDKRGGFKEKLFLIGVNENEKENIFKQYNSQEEKIAREIDRYIESQFNGIKIKSPVTDCIGYKILDTKKFASLTTQDKHSLILHIGKKNEKKGTELQREIDKVLGKSFPRTKSDDTRYTHQAFIKLEWVDDLDQIKSFIDKVYESRKQREANE